MIYIFLTLLIWCAAAVAIGVVIKQNYLDAPKKAKELPAPELTEVEKARERECAYHEDVVRLEVENFHQVRSLDSKNHILECPHHALKPPAFQPDFSILDKASLSLYKNQALTVNEFRKMNKRRDEEIYKESLEALKRYKNNG